MQNLHGGSDFGLFKKMKESQRYLEYIKQGLNEVRVSVVIGSVQILSLF